MRLEPGHCVFETVRSILVEIAGAVVRMKGVWCRAVDHKLSWLTVVSTMPASSPPYKPNTRAFKLAAKSTGCLGVSALDAPTAAKSGIGNLLRIASVFASPLHCGIQVCHHLRIGHLGHHFRH